jgi:hypothetical protein
MEMASETVGVPSDWKVRLGQLPVHDVDAGKLPEPGQIRRIADEARNGRRRHGGDAWGDVLREIGRTGRYRSPSFADEVTARAVARLGNRWDFVLIDCPPALGLLTVSALTAADEVLVPLEASAMALAGLAGLTRTVELVADRLNPGLSIAASLVDVRTSCTSSTPGESTSNCVEFAKAVTRPNVFKNDSSVKWAFASILVIGSVVIFAGLTLATKRK